MKHDKGLLKADKLAAFREWLVAAGFEVRDGKGEFQCLQVKTSPTCWAVVGRNAVGTLSTHPDLRTLINRFNHLDGAAMPAVDQNARWKGEQAFKNFHQRLCERFGYVHDPVDWWRDQASLEEHIDKLMKPAAVPETDQFLDDLRDDFAMHALQGLLAAGHKKPLLDLTGEAYAIADLALWSRGSAKREAQRREP